MYTIGILTSSDTGSKGEREDGSGPAIKEMVADIGIVSAYKIVPDNRRIISETLIQWSDEKHLNLILTTGGTGFSKRDITPEATLDVVQRLVPGIPEAMRQESLNVTQTAMLSRATAGIRGETLIINLPGSPKACRECLEVILKPLKHGLDILMGNSSNCAR
ncbi:molybdenum cofactor biosynthesis protein [endosymbiont 'TC1' of Trimyema compressum]|uniref:MogA/MoaB family molybdenum cofactor biosynthesis protein n=1 Tax=endosymbiont 'TC1' of Trimyema compressum TaxID=243899 RepID=UPI0007F145F7|nr:MogA/MoaB family molybdenum cofactor biosynthesis protein [endosymbiont 'TC1' of Trimyema compressum]AMP20109.1 molybdenum cofactor biosynthesis protein [endosymbiont 'TC1' of Trimyema compressum]